MPKKTPQTIIEKIKQSGLIGRGCGSFPTGLKWELVKKAKGKKTYVICNGSEGEPGTLKDSFVLKNHLEEMAQGVKIAIKTFKNSIGYIYLNPKFYQKYKLKLEKLFKGLPVIIYKEQAGYLHGEETTLINAIAGNRPEPSTKPPYPTEKGLFGYPTLVNNVETFYRVAQIAAGTYQDTKFYSITGDINNSGVHEDNSKITIKELLKKTKNLPKKEFFVQSGGGIMGEILLENELNQPVGGTGALVVYEKEKTHPLKLMKKWAHFLSNENCDKCLPCREGLYRIEEMIDKKAVDTQILNDIFFVMENTSYCPLGRMAPTAFKSLLKKFKKIFK